MSRITHIAAAVYLASQAADAMRIGYANWMFTRGHIGEAAAWDRGKAQYRADAGEAVALSPRDATLRIRYGLALEEAGRAAEAEREFLAAARLSRKYEPRWTLAGFYFRQNNFEPFWLWASEALQVAYRDPEPLFALAWAVEKGGAAIRRRLPIIEKRPLIWRAWVLDAARHGRLDEVEAALDRIGAIDPQPIAEAFLVGGRVQPLTRFGGHRALDWQPIEQEGVQFVRVAHGFALAFKGKQPEQCDVATRLLPATSSARTKWPIEGSVRGLTWRSEPFGRDGLRVTLRYARPPGETRAVGAARVAE